MTEPNQSEVRAAPEPTRWGYGSDAFPNLLQPMPDGPWVYWEDVKHLFAAAPV